MKSILEKFLILIQFMTRIPIFFNIEYSEEKLGKGIKLLPLVGLLIGVILFFESFFLLKIIENKLIISILIVITELLVVGLIHIDGLADTFDGIFSYTEKETMLKIMKDSRIGTNGAVILILYFLSKTILLSEIIVIDIRYLIIFPIVSRLSTSINAAFGTYARDKGMSNLIIEKNNKIDGIFSIILSLILVFFIMYIKGVIVLLIGLIFIFLFKMLIYKKLDGITGDTMGASLELTSIVILIVGVILK